MSYEITVDENQQYIILTTHGDLTNQKAMEQNLEAHALGKQLGINRFLVDSTDSRYIGTPVSHYQFAYEELKTEPKIDAAARVAAVVSPEDHSHDFFETVARNNGMDFTLFRNRENAIRHLLRK
jgi:hypothetical protein